MSQDTTKTIVAAYCRVSTKDEEQLNSLKNQEAFFREYAEKKNYALYDIYADRGISGTKLSRPEFDRMLKDAGLNIQDAISDGGTRIKYVFMASDTRTPKFKRILVKDASRLARNVLIEDIVNELKTKKVYIDFIDDNKSTENDDATMFIQFLQMMSESESRRKSSSVKWGLEQSKNRGAIFTHPKLYGYEHIAETNKEPAKLKAIADEAKIIELIFDLYASGMGVRAVAYELAQKGFLTRAGKEFDKGTIAHILKNQRYTGVNIHNLYDCSGVFDPNQHAPRLRHYSEWEIMPTENIDKIIEPEIFYKCRTITESRAGEQRGLYHGHGDFAKKIVCAVCGSNFIRVTNGKKQLYYMCSKKRYYKKKGCSNRSVKAEAIERAISNNVYCGELLGIKHIRKQGLYGKKKQLEQRLDMTFAMEIEVCENKLLEFRNKQDAIMDLFEQGTISKTQLDKRLANYRPQIDELETSLKDYRKSRQDILNDISDIEQKIETVKSFEVKDYYSREEILADLDYISVAPLSEQSELTGEDNEIEAFFKTRDIILSLQNSKE